MKKFNPNFMPQCKDVTKYIRQSVMNDPTRRVAYKKARLKLRATLPRYSLFTTGGCK